MEAKKENPKGTVLKLDEEIEIFGTEKAQHLVTGKGYKVHPIVAEKLVKLGFATKTQK